MDNLIRNIDGLEYRFSQMGAEQATELLMEISSSVGETVGLLVGPLTSFLRPGKADLNSKLDEPFDPELFAKAARAFFNSTDKKKVVRVLKEFIGDNACTCDNKKINFNVHYQGKLGHMFKVFFAALEAQYGNFSDVLRGVQSFQGQASTPDRIL